MFEPITAFLSAGSTGVFVSVVLTLTAFYREKLKSGESDTVRDYIEWVRRNDHRDLLEQQSELLAGLEEESETITKLMLDLMLLVKENYAVAEDIRDQVDRLP